ncbi:MAG: GNAT family N-acetyltransferase [Chloroflexi bacterium]|nr:GNAT family N-acetyltransferase [Chloroflexota bacterium]
MLPEISLRQASREDVERIARWLDDEEVCSMWFGRYTYGNPIHLGYQPHEILKAPQEMWDRVFDDPLRRIFSIYNTQGEHLGEAQIVVEEALGNAELSLIIGRKDVWQQGYGTATVRKLLKLVFNTYGLFRAWVDVPDYNVPAVKMFEKLGFVHEGTLRQSRPHQGSRYNSCVMGMLSSEFAQRSTLEVAEAPSV